MNYYNEFDPVAAEWLRELIAAGAIPAGDVDERSIADVQPDELRHYAQCHFFAGIGGWAHALALAEWPADKPVWTGSCPCPPFSAAGKGSECPSCGGKSCLSHPLVTAGWVCLDCGDEWRGDDRHLFPEFARLISLCRPATVFGEQVASADGRLWLYALRATMEVVGYACGAADLCAAGYGAPHIRQRLYFGLQYAAGDGRAEPVGRGGGVRMADSDQQGLEGRGRVPERADQRAPGAGGMAGRLADAGGAGSLPRALPGLHRGEEGAGPWNVEPERLCDAGRLADASDAGRIGWRSSQAGNGGSAPRVEPERLCDAGRLADADGRDARAEREQCGREHGLVAQDGGDAVMPGPLHGFWRDADWLGCRDGKWRPVEPGTFPLANGVSGRVGLLRGYGNAIVPQVAAGFIRAMTFP